MRCFDNIAKLIRTKRINHPRGYSQSELSHLLGYKNGQFISNVERALCNVPLKMLGKVSQVLDITPGDIKTAILKDQEETLDRYLAAELGKVNGHKKEADNESFNEEALKEAKDATSSESSSSSMNLSSAS